MKVLLPTTCLASQLSLTGLVELDPYIDSMPLVQQLLTELTIAFGAARRHVNVDVDGIRMQTLNGDTLLDLCPSVALMYQCTLQSLRLEIPNLLEIPVKPIGISANFLQGGRDTFRMHFDRHQLTAIVYLNDAQSMPLIAYPNVRRDPILVGAKDSFDVGRMIPNVIKPRTNSGIIFLGRRTWHGIEDRTTEAGIPARLVNRYSLQFGFDFDPCDYGGQNYYGMDVQLVGEST